MPTASTANPFDLGRRHAAAGVSADRCPWPLHSQKWVRYMNGRNSPAQPPPQPAAVEQPAVAQPALFAVEQ